ncbi:auxin-responsive protein SAUR32 [Cryptomeria japonica]|uniref:auxin-responsive protein SAUR32 n=1 Tax=Cryptomeria japonica TaxID=3369 RepID=UPI0027DA13CA|nr:auxin-responsive protein SAUR32 [Cryptomeria japonica]
MHLPHFPLQFSSKKGEEFYKDVPKGCLALYVGKGEEQRRCVIPVEYINHPLFEKFLKEAEEEYGFEQQGRIVIPCHLSDFQSVQEVIDRESHQSHRHAHVSCFG